MRSSFLVREDNIEVDVTAACSSVLHSAVSADCHRDVQTGTHLATFKDNGSGPNALALLGRDYIVAAQHAKGSLHFWTWHRASALPYHFLRLSHH